VELDCIGFGVGQIFGTGLYNFGGCKLCGTGLYKFGVGKLCGTGLYRFGGANCVDLYCIGLGGGQILWNGIV
jgi:hypothetical protein